MLGFFDRFGLFGFGLASEQTFDFFVGNRIKVDSTSCFGLRRHWRGFRDGCRATEVTCD
jgi:hypothetical protein